MFYVVTLYVGLQFHRAQHAFLYVLAGPSTVLDVSYIAVLYRPGLLSLRLASSQRLFTRGLRVESRSDPTYVSEGRCARVASHSSSSLCPTKTPGGCVGQGCK